MATPRYKIDHLQSGSPVTAGNLSGPDRQIAYALEELSGRVDAAEIGLALVSQDRTVAAATVVGTPVYWNGSAGRYDPAVAAVAADPTTGQLVPAASSLVAGLVLAKSNSTTADLMTGGSAEPDLTALLGAAPWADGLYYLSMSAAGGVTRTRPAVAVPVFHLAGGRLTFVAAAPDVHSHVHYKFPLTAKPAGSHTPPSDPNPHSITSPDAALAGWLPASHASFGGHAPVGAQFGYNLAKDAALSAAFPPVPIGDVAVFRDDADDATVGAAAVPLGSGGLCVVDAYGIWWMTDAYGQVPWQTDYDTASPPSTPTMQVWVEFVRLGHATANTTVTSLTSKSPVLTIKACDGNPAATGGLCADLDFSLQLDGDDDELGGLAVKGLDPDTGVLLRGAVVEGLEAGANVTLTGTVTRRETPGDNDTPLVYQGIVTVTADVDPLGRELPLQLVRLSDVQVRNPTGLLPYLAFPAGQASNLVCRVDVPRVGLPASPKVKLRTEIIAAANGTLPALTLTLLKVAAATTSLVAVPSSSASVAFTPPFGSVTANTYFLAESAAVAVTAGDTLFFTLSRGSDAYTGDVGLLRVGATVTT